MVVLLVGLQVQEPEWEAVEVAEEPLHGRVFLPMPYLLLSTL